MGDNGRPGIVNGFGNDAGVGVRKGGGGFRVTVEGLSGAMDAGAPIMKGSIWGGATEPSSIADVSPWNDATAAAETWEPDLAAPWVLARSELPVACAVGSDELLLGLGGLDTGNGEDELADDELGVTDEDELADDELGVTAEDVTGNVVDEVDDVAAVDDDGATGEVTDADEVAVTRDDEDVVATESKVVASNDDTAIELDDVTDCTTKKVEVRVGSELDADSDDDGTLAVDATVKGGLGVSSSLEWSSSSSSSTPTRMGTTLSDDVTPRSISGTAADTPVGEA
ncbi:hypothetical protein FA95DRAFT_1568291 [Auriscalpium vulgare]|uniref:Uncharacterized protein n=1 Tax=Auriscalpium vulgare TaxID=40419 RepID=A0ACB8SCF4_9AGAM|nr:hypothetical protein FA95DRAFT_1568291 [Auriscalpium vulgare]